VDSRHRPAATTHHTACQHDINTTSNRANRMKRTETQQSPAPGCFEADKHQQPHSQLSTVNVTWFRTCLNHVTNSGRCCGNIAIPGGEERQPQTLLTCARPSPSCSAKRSLTNWQLLPVTTEVWKFALQDVCRNLQSSQLLSVSLSPGTAARRGAGDVTHQHQHHMSCTAVDIKYKAVHAAQAQQLWHADTEGSHAVQAQPTPRILPCSSQALVGPHLHQLRSNVAQVHSRHVNCCCPAMLAQLDNP
jgi:hypothetical protein